MGKPPLNICRPSLPRRVLNSVGTSGAALTAAIAIYSLCRGLRAEIMHVVLTIPPGRFGAAEGATNECLVGPTTA